VPILAKILLRDLLIGAITLALMRLSHALEAAHSMMSVPVAVAAGAAVAYAGFLFHEWGHLAGARVGGCQIALPTSVRSVFLFGVDPARNRREPFLALSLGGFIASGVAVVFLLAVLSFHWLADIVALFLTGLGVLATFVLEIPPAWRVYRMPAGSPAGS